MRERRVVRNPVPSLLRVLMSEHLDPGYAAAAARRPRRGSTRSELSILTAGAVLVGCVFGAAMSHTAGAESDRLGRQQATLASVRAAESRIAALDTDRRSLTDDVDSARAVALQNDTRGAEVLAGLRQLELAAGAEPEGGPGIVVTIAEPGIPSDLSDVSQPARGSSDAAVLDRDLQVVINSLWVSGAEAVAVDEVRIGPGVTVRQAGGAMLVDNQPVFSPYTVAAIGSPSLLQTRFSVSDAYLRMSALAQLYDVGFDVRPQDAVELPGSGVRAIRSAAQGGPP
ncbi:MAG: DUF881 domain-containing protein [Rhodococcus sp. (in: high G+C Gram-positive bacteria)]